MDVQTWLSKEECVGGMGQGSNYAAGKGVQTMPTKVEFVTGTGLRSNYAAGKNALITPKKEEFAWGMEQTPGSWDAALKEMMYKASSK